MLVQKYGGSSLSNPDKIKDIAQAIAKTYETQKKLIVVVSAMGNTTDDLVQLAKQVSSHPTRRELDMLLSAGERISMALMSMSLNDNNVPSISFTGSQAGVFTDGSHSNAQITEIKPIRVKESLDHNKVVVLAGFQGVYPKTKEVTTLGRGGSDTTAVAMAHFFKADQCEILKDVDGVCTADPNIAENSSVLPRLSYDHLANMSFWGSKVLHYRAVELAKKLHVPLFIGSSVSRERGTLVSDSHTFSEYEDNQLLSVNSHRFVEHLSIQSSDMQNAIQKLDEFIRKHDLPSPQILATKQETDHCRVMLTNDKESLLATMGLLKGEDQINNLNKPLASVTITCYQTMGTQMAKVVLDQLKTVDVAPEKLISDSMCITVFVPQEQREAAIDCLHKLINS